MPPRKQYKPVAVTTPKKAKDAAAAAGSKKRAKGYQTPVKIPLGLVFTDLAKQSWRIGKSIGSGGFGDIYSACKDSEKSKNNPSDYRYAVKIEPHGNGPLFVEMHFYSRNAKTEDIEAFRKSKGLEKIGMSHFLGHGSTDLENLKHRFIIMPRYGKDIWSIFLENDRKLPVATIYRIAIQMLYVLEYIHKCTYIHGDIKGANILLGFDKTDTEQTYLVDFGLAGHYTTSDTYKSDPKKMHNGTIEYTSRDAHMGVQTMRGDLEILGYNVLQWLAGKLPWEEQKLLNIPKKVQEEKEQFMKTLDKSIGKCLSAVNSSQTILNYFKYVDTIKFNGTPDYDRCRKLFENALKELKQTNSGPLDFKLVKTVVEKPRTTTTTPTKRNQTMNVNNDKVSPKKKSIKTYVLDTSEETIVTDEESFTEESPIAKNHRSPAGRKRNNEELLKSPAQQQQQQQQQQTHPRKKSRKGEPILNKTKSSTEEPIIMDAIVPSSKELTQTRSQSSNGIRVNDEMASSGKKSKKTLHFNVELDVSLDANIVVNVRRKKRSLNDHHQQQQQLNESTEALTNNENENNKTPVGAKMRVVANAKNRRGGDDKQKKK